MKRSTDHILTTHTGSLPRPPDLLPLLYPDDGATPHELMSIFGWLTLKEAERYTRAAEQKKIAARAMPMLERGEKRT